MLMLAIRCHIADENPMIASFRPWCQGATSRFKKWPYHFCSRPLAFVS